MTGKDVIELIKKNGLENVELTEKEDGQFIEFVDNSWYNKVLWLTDDWLQDVLYNPAGSISYS